MSIEHGTETLPPIGTWIARLVERLAEDPAASARLGSLVEGRSARIQLDDDSVVVRMHCGELQVDTGEHLTVDGYGATTSAVVSAILDGDLEANEALRDGLIQAVASPDDVATLFQAVEVLLDASARVPSLRALAAEFREGSRGAHPMRRRERPDTRELKVLDRLGLGGDA